MIEINLDVQVIAAEMKGLCDGALYVFLTKHDEKLSKQDVEKRIPGELGRDLTKLLLKREFDFKAGSKFSCDLHGQRVSLCVLDIAGDMFSWLSAARQVIGQAALDVKVRTFKLDLKGCGKHSVNLANAFVSAICAGLYKFPKYETKKSISKQKENSQKPSEELNVSVIIDKAQEGPVEQVVSEAVTRTTSGTNLVRWLSKRAGNDLSCKVYIDYLKQMSQKRKWTFEHINHKKLVTMKAGSFLAVVQGSEHQDYGIVKMVYSPPKAKKHLTVVGKGLVFDTGGHNLKTSHMLGMHGDMAGSAVALAVLNVATLEKWPIKVTAFVAIADNMIGPKSYKPNDIVTTLNGTTIEVIDTDAEGRMVLADTLTLAAKEKANLMMDFATLTGACVRAIGTTFSGVFSNKSALVGPLIESGYASGERVWPFPMDKDFAECLESTSADTKQCREKGGVDHIEASQFLMRFAGKDIPWVHVDLSSIENTGGLGHVATDETGFGVRFACEFIKRNLNF
jgi:leucyl aminopeptidase